MHLMALKNSKPGIYMLAALHIDLSLKNKGFKNNYTSTRKNKFINILLIDGKTPLHLGAENGTVISLQALVDLGADIWITDSNGDTAINIATKCGKIDAEEFLETALVAGK